MQWKVHERHATLRDVSRSISRAIIAYAIITSMYPGPLIINQSRIIRGCLISRGSSSASLFYELAWPCKTIGIATITCLTHRWPVDDVNRCKTPTASPLSHTSCLTRAKSTARSCSVIECPKRRTSPIREILCYTSALDAQLLADTICSCTTLVHQHHDIRNLSVSGKFNASWKIMRCIISLNILRSKK